MAGDESIPRLPAQRSLQDGNPGDSDRGRRRCVPQHQFCAQGKNQRLPHFATWRVSERGDGAARPLYSGFVISFRV